MKTLIKLINPLSDHPTEMWLQAIADFEAILKTPGYKINMDYWYFPSEDEVCVVCMAGASMAKRTGGLARQATPNDYSEQDRRKLCSIDEIREGHFKYAIDWLNLPKKEEDKWIEAIQAADLRRLRSSLPIAHIEEDWCGLIKLLRKAIARIDAEYDRLTAEPAEPALPPDDHPGWDRLTDALNTR